MNSKVGISIIVVGLLILLGVQQYIIWTNYKASPPQISNYELLKSIDSIRADIRTLQLSRDSLQEIIDTSKVQIINIENRYETIRDHIIHQSVDSDCIVFAKYISSHKGLLSSSNASTAENN